MMDIDELFHALESEYDVLVAASSDWVISSLSDFLILRGVAHILAAGIPSSADLWAQGSKTAVYTDLCEQVQSSLPGLTQPEIGSIAAKALRIARGTRRHYPAAIGSEAIRIVLKSHWEKTE